MNFGYLIFASNENVDYLKMAYCLAISIKNTQKAGYDKVALVIDDKSKVRNLNSPWVFDNVIEWNEKQGWDGRSWMDELTPFEHTVCLDADMLFLRDYSHWIDYFIENKTELYLPSKSYTFRNELVKDNFYRKTFEKNELPNLYSFYTYFEKNSDLAKEFFTLGRFIIENPIEFSNLFLSSHIPKILGTDEAFALSAKILDISDKISYNLDFPRVTHLKPRIQDWSFSSDKVTDHVGFYLNDQGNLKIGNFEQTNIIHYVEKDLMTNEYVSLLEDILWSKKQ